MDVVTDPGLVATVTATSTKSDATLCTAIYGNPGCVYAGVPQRLVPGEVTGADQLPLNSTPPTGLIPYYENVYFPRLIELSKTQQGAADKSSTLLNELNSRTQQAAQYANYTQDVQKMTLNNQVQALGRADVLCPEPSMGQSSLALQLMALAARQDLEKVSAKEMAGDKTLPAYARGKYEYDKARVSDRLAAGLCTQYGSNGTNEKYCANTVAAVENADETIGTLTGTWLYDTAENSQQRTSVNMVKRFIDNVFATRVFEPIPAWVTAKKPLSDKLVQAVSDQTSYTALISTFQNPFLSEQADRTPVNGSIASVPSLSAALDRAGYTGDAKNMYIKDSKTSRAAEEYVRFKVYESDPKTVTVDIAGLGGLSTNNLLSESIVKQMKQITLMYDIREQIKQTNMLLGAIGVVLSEGKYQNIRQQISNAMQSEEEPQ